MLDLARAYKKPGSEFYNKPEVIKVSSAALDFGLPMILFAPTGGGMKWEHPTG
jgi:hypothetical protein